jgi:3-deoxy-D-manno-octulosonic-acid transferase
MMLLYSIALALALLAAAPWWLFRMITTERYRQGLGQRLGKVPAALREAVRGRQVVWLHAVSVGEVLAATRLVQELETALGDGWRVVISTTTRTGQALAQKRFGPERVFYFPLDFAMAVRAYLRALNPRALVLMESELWPRLLHECSARRVGVAVVNARVSDRSFARTKKFHKPWARMARHVTLWLTQSEEDARRIVALGMDTKCVRVSGNLKYDVRAPKQSRIAELIREAAAGRPILVAGSTTAETKGDRGECEEAVLVRAWQRAARNEYRALLVLAPRHPERFPLVRSIVKEFAHASARDWTAAAQNVARWREDQLDVVLLDTIGDLAGVYGVATAAFVGGSLVKRGGHNPLEPAQFGVPVLMGPSFENFRDIVTRMQAVDGIRIVKNEEELQEALVQLLAHSQQAQSLGERGREVFEQQQGATKRTLEALLAMVNA